MVYQIRIKGHLDRHWTEWFDGLTITLEEDGNTLLTGTVLDQAAKKVRDLGMTFDLALGLLGASVTWLGLWMLGSHPAPDLHTDV